MPLAENSFIILESVDSTNNYAMAMVHEGSCKARQIAYFAIEQTAGKGQARQSMGKQTKEKI